MSQQVGDQNSKDSAEANEERSLKKGLKYVGDVILGFSETIKSTKSDIETSEVFNSIKKQKKEFDEEISSPFCQYYRNLPAEITDFKFSLISPYSFNQRFTAINLACVLTAILTFRRFSDINLGSRILRAFRNSGMLYLGGGLIITPEIYNPLMKDA